MDSNLKNIDSALDVALEISLEEKQQNPFIEKSSEILNLSLDAKENQQPEDHAEAQLLVDLAFYLTMYGAPIYRVESRVEKAAELLGLQVSGFYLPTKIMISIGDGSLDHPSRTYFKTVPMTYNMQKLQRVDKLAKKTIDMISKRHREMFSNPNTTDFAKYRITQNEHKTYSELVDKLKAYAASPNLYSNDMTMLGSAACSGCIALMFFDSSWQAAVMAFILGGFSNVMSQLLENHVTSSSILIALFISFIARVGQAVSVSMHSVAYICHSTLSIVALARFLPGFMFAISMFEFGASYPVAGTVRLVMGFIRSFQIGFGTSMGSNIAIEVLKLFDVWKDDYLTLGCEIVEPKAWWRHLFFIPMMFGLLVTLNSHSSQWKPMIISCSVSYTVLAVTSYFLSVEYCLILSAFALGVTANLFARHRGQTAIASIFLGIHWLVPGAVGVIGAKDALEGGGTNFAMIIIARSISITIGMYLANVLVFPLVPSQKRSEEDNTMAI